MLGLEPLIGIYNSVNLYILIKRMLKEKTLGRNENCVLWANENDNIVLNINFVYVKTLWYFLPLASRHSQSDNLHGQQHGSV